MRNFRFLPIIVSVVIGLAAGLGIGHIQTSKVQKICEDKMKEADRKVAFMERQMENARTEAATTTSSVQQQCKDDQDKLGKLQVEEKALNGQVGRLKDQLQQMESRASSSDEALARSKKELVETSARTKKEIQELERNNRDLETELKKTTGQNQTVQTQLQSDLKKTTQDLKRCVSNNAELCLIAEELLKKYRQKGLGAVLAEKEPLTEIRKVELEQFTQKYREEIERLKVEKK
jgi:predicted  nucleic acid-binding Zn-ribbon protein